MKEAMTMLRQHAVVTFHRPSTDLTTTEVHKKFLNPGAFLEPHCKAYTRDGWTVFSVQLCTREEYLNYRLDDVVESINDTEHERERLRQQFRDGVLDVDSYTTALTVVVECVMSDMRRLHKLMNRIWDNDYSVQNEEAIQLYNAFFT